MGCWLNFQGLRMYMFDKSTQTIAISTYYISLNEFHLPRFVSHFDFGDFAHDAVKHMRQEFF